MRYLVLAVVAMVVAYGLAGSHDVTEAERLSLQGYVNDHASVSSKADDLPGLDRLPDVRYAELSNGECR